MVHLYKSGVVSKSRFISGGHQLISNVSYFEAPANVILVGFRMKGIHDVISVHFRDPEDWGWVGHTLDGMAYSCTADDKLNFSNELKSDALRIDAAEVEVQELRSPLKDGAGNGLYRH